MNGYVAGRGHEVGIAAPAHAALASLVKRIERGEDTPSAELIPHSFAAK